MGKTNQNITSARGNADTQETKDVIGVRFLFHMQKRLFRLTCFHRSFYILPHAGIAKDEMLCATKMNQKFFSTI